MFEIKQNRASREQKDKAIRDLYKHVLVKNGPMQSLIFLSLEGSPAVEIESALLLLLPRNLRHCMMLISFRLSIFHQDFG